MIFADHEYWHRVSNRPNVVITIDTGYQNRPSCLWRTTSFITGSHTNSVLWQARDPGGGEDLFFFFFFWLVSSAPPIRQGISEVCNIATGYAFECFLLRYIVTGCIFLAPSALWQGQVLTPPPPSGTPISSWEVECPPPPPGRYPIGEGAKRSSGGRVWEGGTPGS